MAPGKRCYYHGAYNTGPRSLAGKRRNGSTLKLYRVNGAPKGHRKTGKAAARRLARARREVTQAIRDERKRLKALRWANRQRIKQGLPLLTQAELDSLGQVDVTIEQWSEPSIAQQQIVDLAANGPKVFDRESGHDSQSDDLTTQFMCDSPQDDETT